MMDRKAAAKRHALLVEDDDGLRRALQLFLHWRGFDVRSYATLAPALDGCLSNPIDVLVADYRLPDGRGVDVLRRLRAHGWRGRSVLITGASIAELRRDAATTGFDTILEKPLYQLALLAAIGS